MRIFFLLVGVLFAFLTGCGGGNRSLLSAAKTSTGRGRATISIKWPARSRLIPTAANSIQVAVTQTTKPLDSKLLVRPAAGGTTTVTFDALPVGDMTATATAYPNADGTGTAQATASVPLHIQDGQNTAFTITMATTITQLTLSPTSSTVAIGKTATLTATAHNAAGEVVLFAPGTLQWSAANSSIATVADTGQVTALALGTTQITALEKESGVSAVATITVAAVDTFAYFAGSSNDIGQVSQYRVNGDGTLTPLSPPYFSTGVEGYTTIAVHPTKPFVYVAHANDDNTNHGTITQYSVNADGTLAPLSPPSVSTGNVPRQIIIHPNGRFAYTADSGSNTVSQFQVNADGTLTPLSPPWVGGDIRVLSLAIDSTGQYLYTMAFAGDVYQYKINADGTLSELHPAAFTTGGAEVARLDTDPLRPFVYIPFDTSGLAQCGINADGTLRWLSPKTLPISGNARFVYAHPKGAYIYCVSAFDGIRQFRVNGDGTLSLLTSDKVLPGYFGGFLAFEPTGKFAYSNSYDPNGPTFGIHLLKINADGTLVRIPNADLPGGGTGMVFVQIPH